MTNRLTSFDNHELARVTDSDPRRATMAPRAA